MTRAIIRGCYPILIAAAFNGCASAPVQAVPEVPRLSCLNLAEIPMAPGWFLYACRFVGTPPEAPTPPVVLEGS